MSTFHQTRRLERNETLRMVVNGSIGHIAGHDGDATLPVPVEACRDAPISAPRPDTLMATTPCPTQRQHKQTGNG
jgi:hypothetical protein